MLSFCCWVCWLFFVGELFTFKKNGGENKQKGKHNFHLFFICLFPLYHGKPPLNQHREDDLLLFPSTLSKSKKCIKRTLLSANVRVMFFFFGEGIQGIDCGDWGFQNDTEFE